MKKAFILIVMLLLAFAAVGFAAASNENFTMAYNGVVTMNPLMTQASNDHNVFYLTQLQLVRYYGTDMEFDAAESFDMSDDATVYTFHLRDGLKWSDGEPVTAYDFETTMKWTFDPEFGCPSAQKWYMIKNSEAYSTGSDESLSWEDVGVKALDDKTIQFTMERPLSTFAETVATKSLYPLRSDFVDSIGADKLGSSVDTMLYSGPYVISNWVLESSMDLVKNENYWNAENSFPVQNIHLVEVEDPNTEVAMFENGEVDAIEQISSQYYGYMEPYKYNVSGGGFMFLWMNGNGATEASQALMSNVNFRQALNYGFNREATTALVDAAAQPANRPIDPSFSGPNGGLFVDEYPVETVPLTGDTEKAKEYLAAAMEELGYSSVDELPQLSIVTWDTAGQKLLGESIIDQWKQNLGLNNIQLNQYVIGTAIGKFFDLTYDIFMITWETEVLPTDILQAMATGGECNAGIWSDEEFDTLVKQSVDSIDPVEKAEFAHQAEQRFLDLAYIQPVWLEGQFHAVQDYVDGFVIEPRNGYAFNHLEVNN